MVMWDNAFTGLTSTTTHYMPLRTLDCKPALKDGGYMEYTLDYNWPPTLNCMERCKAIHAGRKAETTTCWPLLQSE